MTATLLVTEDPTLHDDVLRLAAAAGVDLEVTGDLGAARSSWASAAAVLVGSDLARGLAAAAPGRRPGVHLLARGRVPDRMFRVGVELGVESVAELPASEPWLAEVLSDAADGAPAAGVLIGVVGGSGGAGATTFAAALALTLGQRCRTLLVDADPDGPGLDRVLGIERRVGIRWEEVASTTGRLSARSLREAVPTCDDVGVLTWGGGDRAGGAGGTAPFAVREVLAAGRRGHDAVVVDLPRRASAEVEEVIARCQELIVLSRLTVPAVTSAARMLPRLGQVRASRRLVARGPGAVPADEAARLLRCSLAVAMPDQRGIDEAVDLGAGPLRSRRGSLARAASQVADLVGPGGQPESVALSA